MAYNPADLRLPPWLLRFLDWLITLRLPIAKHWHIGMTRAGVIMLFTLIGLWSAAFYSGNNLLYLCGGMMTAISIAALWRGISMFKGLPLMGTSLPPILEVGSPYILRKELHHLSHHSALIKINYLTSKNSASQTISLQARLTEQAMVISGKIMPTQRGVIQYAQQQLSTSAPLGLWELTCQRHDTVDYLVLPKKISWLAAHGSSEHSSYQHIEGDEYHDLRAYSPGDAVAHIHWRKSTLEPNTWRIKRFQQSTGEPQQTTLIVDLRVPSIQHSEAFERLLGMAYFWLASQTPQASPHIVIGQQAFHCLNATEYALALTAIAKAQTESIPPLHQHGIILSLMAKHAGLPI